MWAKELPYNLLAETIISGRLVPFLGAGASLREDSKGLSSQSSSESLPTARELADLLARELNLDAEAPNARSLLEVATYFELYMGRGPLQERLRSIFLNAYRPGSLHRFLADLTNPILIMTSNYDTLIEGAFLAKKKPYHLLVTPAARSDLEGKLLWWKPNEDRPVITALKEFELPLKDVSIIFKIHGSVDPYSEDFDSFVVTEDDYFEMAGRFFLKSMIPSSIQMHLNRSNIIFFGYSLRDIHLRHVLKQNRHAYRKFAIVKSISWIESHMWMRLDIEPHELLIEDFVETFRTVLKASGTNAI